jgi:hypothetical protein
VAESEETVVVVPRILEVAEVELEVAIRVAVHVRHPVVAIGVDPHTMCNRLSVITETGTSRFLYFIPSLIVEKLYCSIMYCTD